MTPEQLKNFLEPQQYKLYSLIWKRTLATQMALAELEDTTVTLNPQGHPQHAFVAKGTAILFAGFMKLYIEGTDTDDEEEGLLPKLERSEICTKKKFDTIQSFTKPPARYTEETLVKKLESEGIGRPSTYAPTISTIIDKGYVEKKEKHLWPTDIAFVVNDLLVEHFAQEVDYKFTAKLEEDFDRISEGEVKWQTVIDDFYKPFGRHLKKKQRKCRRWKRKQEKNATNVNMIWAIKFGRFGKFMACSNYPECKNIKPMKEEEDRKKELEQKFADKKCEKCESPSIVKKGRFGEFLACSNYPECSFTAPIVNATGVKCPECKEGDMVERKSKRGKLFYSCSRYPDCKKAVWNKPYEKPCMKCGGMTLWQKKGIVKCESCGKRESEEVNEE